MLERRKFLTALSATMLTAAIPSGTLAATLTQTGQCCPLRKQFAQLVDSDFRLVNSAGVTQIARLVAVDDGPDCSGLEQFSIVFESGDLTEGLYKAYHPGIGTLRIGLLPTGETGSEVNRQRAHFSNFV